MSDTTMSNEFPTNVFVAPHTPQTPTVTVSEPSAVQISNVIDSLDAAAILTVTPNNLRQIVHKKQLVPVGKRGRRTLFNRADVEALAAARRNGSVS
jgi:hypothetical protein